MPWVLPFLVAILLPYMGLSKAGANGRDDNCTKSHPLIGSIGGIVDLGSRVGKEQKIAVEIAINDSNKSTCSKLALPVRDSSGSSARAASADLGCSSR